MSGLPFMSESDSGTSSTTPPSSPLRSKSKKGKAQFFMSLSQHYKMAGNIKGRKPDCFKCNLMTTQKVRFVHPYIDMLKRLQYE